MIHTSLPAPWLQSLKSWIQSTKPAPVYRMLKWETNENPATESQGLSVKIISVVGIFQTQAYSLQDTVY